MRELSLFSGAGGGLLGSKLLGWTTVGYVEYEKYCQKVLRQRIADGILDAAPIFGDIRKFISEGYADAYQGMVDVVTGGFPCQPFSTAGKRLAENDHRNMWPSTVEIIRRIRPRIAFLENVPGLLSTDYVRRIFGDLAEVGFNCRWGIVGASDIGANHRRKRLWILAYPNEGRRSTQFRQQQEERSEIVNSGCKTDVADSKYQGLQIGWGIGDVVQVDNRFSGIQTDDITNLSIEKDETLAYPKRSGSHSTQNEQVLEGKGGDKLRPIKSGNNGSNWWTLEPTLGRVAHGVANRVDRLKAIGNGQVPLCMAYAFSKLSEGIIE